MARTDRPNFDSALVRPNCSSAQTPKSGAPPPSVGGLPNFLCRDRANHCNPRAFRSSSAPATVAQLASNVHFYADRNRWPSRGIRVESEDLALASAIHPIVCWNVCGPARTLPCECAYRMALDFAEKSVGTGLYLDSRTHTQQRTVRYRSFLYANTGRRYDRLPSTCPAQPLSGRE